MTATGVITNPTEIDVYRVHLYPNVEYWATASGSGNKQGFIDGLTLYDPFVAVLDPETQATIGVDDNSLPNRDAQTRFVVPVEKDYFVSVGDATGGTGSYQVAVVDVATANHGAVGDMPLELFAEFAVNPQTGTFQPITVAGVPEVQESGLTSGYLLT